MHSYECPEISMGTQLVPENLILFLLPLCFAIDDYYSETCQKQ